jgi:hypothetical protein
MRACLRWGLASTFVLAPARLEAAPPVPPVEAAPAQERPERVIPPGREDAARELLAPVVRETPYSLRWLGPRIEVDRIKWWLMRDEEARAILVLVPRELAGASDPLSKSFAIQIAWAPEVEPRPRERELLAAAVEAVQAGDRGQFYLVQLDLFEDEGRPPPPYAAKPVAEPAQVHRRWGLELAAVALLGLVALGITLRPDRARSGAEQS